MLIGTRREMFTTAGLLVAASGARPGAASGGPSIEQDLARYIALGGKASGGPGDEASGVWLEAELKACGYATERQRFDAPYFETEHADLVSGDARASVLPQAIVVQTGPEGVTGRLVRVTPLVPAEQALRGAIALVDLPYGRWSSAGAKPILDTVRATFADGAVAAVLVTNGPTGKAIALNCDGRRPVFGRPVAILAPELAVAFLAAAAGGASATLRLTGKSGTRPAFNLIGRRERPGRPWIIISTPRSGWFTCAGERGPGVAAWLALARWAPGALPDASLALICNSGHEYERLGAGFALQVAPNPSRTAFWLHLGANVAARDWHEIGGGRQSPLETADAQRFLMVSPAHLELARQAFLGLPGLGSPYPVGEGPAGELSNIIRAGYASVAGIFGAHRYHHTMEDDAHTVEPRLVEPVLGGCRALIEHAGGRFSGP
ncbi:hypothetical protein [Sphingomonas sp. OTU376]|uniref:hypothetical protein n=1 Tax=Sphingomonas sp. OTU376 TaxID=3043863 RepID=UPI00313E4664